MSEQDNNGTGAPEAPETPAATGDENRYKNLQSELDRKLGNISQSIEERFNQILTHITPKNEPVNTPTKRPSVYEDEEAFASAIETRAAQSAANYAQSLIDRQQKISSTVNQFQNDYPELRDTSTDAYRKADQKVRSLPENQRTPEAIRMALLETVAEEGLVNVSKRPRGGSDDFSLSSSGSGSRSRRASAEPETTPEQAAFAEYIGAPVNDPAFQKILKQAQKRKNWSQHE